MTRFITKIAAITVLALSAFTMTAPVAQAQTTTQAVRFDKTKFPEERQSVKAIAKDFPKLGDDFEVLGKSTGHVDKAKPTDVVYNCIAWSVGITGNWEWPSETRTVDGKRVLFTNVKIFDNFYKKHGYTRLALRDTTSVAGQQKITLYGKLNANGELEVTHASRQEADQTWSSKLGGLALIKHRTPEALTGPCYGEPIAVYVKYIGTQSTTGTTQYATSGVANKIVGTWTASVMVEGSKGVEAIALLDNNAFGLAAEYENGKKTQFNGTYVVKGNVIEFTMSNGHKFQGRVVMTDDNRMTVTYDKGGMTPYQRLKS